MLPGPIYAITDPLLLPGERLFSGVEAALRGGVRLVQLRDKTALDEQLLALARPLVALCRDYGALCLINDRPHTARAAEAQGVHLGQSDGSIAAARRLLGPRALIGATCHSDLSLAHKAILEGADYVAFGRFFISHTKPGASAAPLSLIADAQSQCARPVVAIGGIDCDNMAPLAAAGADILAVCHSLFAAPDITAAAQRLIQTYRLHAPGTASG